MGQEFGQDLAGKAHSLRGVWHVRWGSQISPLPGLPAGTPTRGPLMHLGLPHGMAWDSRGGHWMEEMEAERGTWKNKRQRIQMEDKH